MITVLTAVRESNFAGRPTIRLKKTVTGQEIRRLMRVHRITIRSLAARMQITMVRVREVRTQGLVGDAYCQDWQEAITGTGIFAAKENHDSP